MCARTHRLDFRGLPRLYPGLVIKLTILHTVNRHTDQITACTRAQIHMQTERRLDRLEVREGVTFCTKELLSNWFGLIGIFTAITRERDTMLTH